MGRPLKLLLLEDSRDDEELLLRLLVRGGYDPQHKCVQTAEDFRSALNNALWDVIISDHEMPRFNSSAALEIYKEKELDIPFIIVSGHIGEEIAVAAMKAGAHDYVMKDKLARLGPAIERELREAEERRGRRHSQEALRQSQEQLTLALEAAVRARQEAEAATQARDQFLAALSHELRTPLTPVLLTVSMLKQDKELSSRVINALCLIERNIELESKLIDDLLDLSRITHKKIQFKFAPLDVHQCVRRAVEICKGELEAKAQSLSVDLDARRTHVTGDSARLQQVFWNLIKNAVKFTPPKGKIAIASRNVQDAIQIEIVDSGIGIEPAVIPRLFAPFEQGDAGITQQFGGLGLGLAICKAAVEAHGGKLSAASLGRNRGSVFTVQLGTLLDQG